MKSINKVAIVGGTHGNEITGPHLIKHWTHSPDEITRPSFDTKLLLGNPRAFAENRRFIDEDLNRCFSEELLAKERPESYESKRAIQLAGEIGPKDNPKVDFLIDLHTSTSNCGVMIILLQEDAFSLRLAACLSATFDQARIHSIPMALGGQQALGSLARHSVGIEIGPVPQGVLRFEIFDITRRVVNSTLDFIDSSNNGTPPLLPEAIDVFEFTQSLTFPGDNEYADAIIHESLQDRDYQPMRTGDPLFRRLDGSEICYDGADTVYPVFINEAAYYGNRKAMSLTKKRTIRVPGV